MMRDDDKDGKAINEGESSWECDDVDTNTGD